MNDSQIDLLPKAKVQPDRGVRWVWLIPAVALVFCVGLWFKEVVQHGPIITLSLSHGHGVKAGDLLRCQGVVVGQVQRVALGPNLRGVRIVLRLDPAAAELARAGSRFWVQRPRVSFTGVGGLETIAGPRYLVALPGDGPAQHHFVALDEPPAVTSIDAGGLELVLVAQSGGGLRAAMPVTYRQMPIGKVLSVGLATDATSVHARVYIHPAYQRLVRHNSRFWLAEGVRTDVGLKGIRFRVESLQSLVEGRIAMATPSPPGQQVHCGSRFVLDSEPKDAWLDWRPPLPVGSALLPPGALLPDMQRISLACSGSARLWFSKRRRQGWVLPVDNGLLGLADLFGVDDKQSQCVIAGQPVDPVVIQLRGDLAWVKLSVTGTLPWPVDRMAVMSKAEHCLILTGSSDPPIPVDAINLQRSGDRWRINPAIGFEASSHGAAVLSRRTGGLVGFLVVEAGGGQIVPVTTHDRRR